MHKRSELASRDQETALFFVLDSSFLHPTKVLLHSLKRHSSLNGCPIVVITNDPVVAEDSFLKDVCSEIEFWSDDDLSVFTSIRGDRIDERLKKDFAPKFTFLKLSLFLKRGYTRHIFIDSDMLCLSTLDEEMLCSAYDAKACREYGVSKFPTPNEPQQENQSDIARNFIAEHESPVPSQISSINSGFLVLEEKALRKETFDLAINLASNKSYPNEQSVTGETLKNIDANFLRLPIWYNARRRIFASQGEAYFEEVRDKIKLLHYTPGKPWKMGEKSLKTYDRIWLEYAKELDEY